MASRCYSAKKSAKAFDFNSETFELEVVKATENPDQVLLHDEKNKIIAQLLLDLSAPMALGVIYKNPADSFEHSWYAARAQGLERTSSVAEALHNTDTWTV